jgi:HD superfamily phosphohydrolase
MKDTFNLKTIIIIGIFVFLALYVSKCSHDNETEKLRTELKKETLRNDTLKKISEDIYEKLVADSLTKKELFKILKQLEIDVKNPKIITRIEYKQKDVEKEVDEIKLKDSILQIIDFYPNKDQYTLKYSSDINLINKKGKGKFEFIAQSLDLVISETEKGLWKATLKTDNEFVEINSLDVQTLPDVTQPQKSNWAKFGGVKYNTNLNDNKNLEILGGVRYKKLSVLGSANSSSQLGLGFMLDF